MVCVPQQGTGLQVPLCFSHAYATSFKNCLLYLFMSVRGYACACRGQDSCGTWSSPSTLCSRIFRPGSRHLDLLTVSQASHSEKVWCLSFCALTCESSGCHLDLIIENPDPVSGVRLEVPGGRPQPGQVRAQSVAAGGDTAGAEHPGWACPAGDHPQVPQVHAR